MTSDHVKDGSVARFVLNVVVVELTNDGDLIRSNDSVSVSMFIYDPFGGIESLGILCGTVGRGRAGCCRVLCPAWPTCQPSRYPKLVSLKTCKL